MRANRGVDDAAASILLRGCPYRERERSAGAQHPARFRERRAVIGDVDDAEVRDDRIELRRPEVERRRVTDTKVDAGGAHARDAHHLGRDVDADRYGAAVVRRFGRVSGTTCDVEHVLATPDARSVE